MLLFYCSNLILISFQLYRTNNPLSDPGTSNLSPTLKNSNESMNRRSQRPNRTAGKEVLWRVSAAEGGGGQFSTDPHSPRL